MKAKASWSKSVAFGHERRSEQRYPSEDDAIVTILTSGSVFQGRTVDISRSGLRVRVTEPLETGSRLRIKFGTTFAFGTVRWCSQVNGVDYDCGILVEHTLAQSLVDSVHQALERVRKNN